MGGRECNKKIHGPPPRPFVERVMFIYAYIHVFPFLSWGRGRVQKWGGAMRGRILYFLYCITYTVFFIPYFPCIFYTLFLMLYFHAVFYMLYFRHFFFRTPYSIQYFYYVFYIPLTAVLFCARLVGPRGSIKLNQPVFFVSFQRHSPHNVQYILKEK